MNMRETPDQSFPDQPFSYRPCQTPPPAHGGDLQRAIVRYGRPLAEWLDLSAALNPDPYPLPALSPTACHQLPGDLSALLAAARDYYGAPHAVALPGSQAAIQWLPLLRPRSTVAVPAIGYREHWFRWQWANHDVATYDPRDAVSIDRLLAAGAIDVLLVINPNNPTGDRFERAQLLDWWQRLQQRGGWLVVDEAFADTEPALSLAAESDRPGLVLLRSLGKFFGLPGIRCGFALGGTPLLERLGVAVGPWPLPAFTIEAALQALCDYGWQAAARQRLQAIGRANRTLLAATLPAENSLAGTDLFLTATLPESVAEQLHTRLAQRGVWTRLIMPEPSGSSSAAMLRFGMVDPAAAENWERYRSALASCGADQ